MGQAGHRPDRVDDAGDITHAGDGHVVDPPLFLDQ